MGAPRRRTTWARNSGTATFAAAGYHTFDLLSAYTALGGPVAGITVARTRLLVSVATNPAAGDSLGIGVLRGQNTDVGLSIAGAPNVITDTFEDWAFWSVYFGGAAAQTGVSYFEHGTGAMIEIDVRAKRKMPELQQSWNLVIQSTNGTDIVNWSSSTLLMLP